MPEAPQYDEWVVQRGGFHGIPPALPESINVVPEDLSQFATMLREDIDEFHTAKRAAVDEMFGVFPSFRGDPAAGQTGGLPEGRAFEEAYWRVQSALSMLLGEAGIGLMLLQMVATTIGAAYQNADLFSPEFEGDGSLAQVLGGAGLLARPPRGPGQDETTGPELTGPAHEQWEDFLADVDSGENAAEESPDSLGGQDRDLRTTEVLHEHQPGEYVSDTDQDAVQFRDAGFQVTEFLPYDTVRDDVSLVLDNDQWEHPLPEETWERP